MKNKSLGILLLIAVFVVLANSAITNPIDALGTVLPVLNAYGSYLVSPHRIFNDLMKQSLPLVPYLVNSYGGSGRCYSCTLNQIGGLKHQYPARLPTGTWAVAEIPFFSGIDDALQNQIFNLKYSGNGMVGVYQQNQFNLTWTTGTGGQFSLKVINQSLFVYIFTTDPTNPVKNITILPASLGSNPPTYTSNFLYYLKPFNLLRTCYWQGQNLYTSRQPVQTWGARTLVSSSTQVSSTGVALEHILELETAANSTLWPCIPDTADINYVTQMASLIGSSRNRSNIMYLEFGNVFTLLNDFPDVKTSPIFDNFMVTYGYSYRSSVLFTINYKDIQYYINAMGMRKTPINFTYIDAIGAQPNFGNLAISDVWNADQNEIKSNLTNFMLSYEVTLNRAYQIAKRNGTNLITFSGGPYIKTPRYGYIWRNKSDTTYSVNASIQYNLALTLLDMNQNDPWVGEFYLQWLGRLKSMGIKSILFSQLTTYGYPAFNYDMDYVPLVPFFNATTPAYRALNDSVFSGRVSTLPISGSVPSNPSICSPQCVWGDCILNSCSCYAGYSGPDCSIYTPINQQNKIGVNLQGVSYYTTQTPFVDLHREGSDWVYFLNNGGWNSGLAFKNQVPLDQDGYPTYLPPGIRVGTLMARDIATHYDPGNYTVYYDGDGILSFVALDVTKVYYGIGKCIITVVPSTNMNNGILVTIERTNPNNYIRNIRVIRPGFQNTWWTQKFSPLLLEKIAPFGTIRFMDWTNTNAQTDTEWNTRTQQSQRTYTRNGVAWQQVIHLANLLGKNVWINIPHLASNNYITELAKLFYSKLEPHLTVYVEYSNQVWGTLFPGGQYAQQQGVQYYSNKSRITPLNNATDPVQAQFCYLSMKTQNISDIWRSVFSAPADDKRLQIVVSTQSVNADTTRRILACENGYKKVNFVAIAPYLAVNLNSKMSQIEVFNQMNDKISNLSATIKQHLIQTNKYNLPLGCYESGQGLIGRDTTTNQLQIGVQTDSRMQALYLDYFQMLFNNSISLANHFTDTSKYSQYGSWGLFQYADERLNSSVKYAGLLSYLQEQNLPVSSNFFGACTNNCNGNGICNFGRCTCYNDFTGPNCEVAKFIDFVDCGYLCTFNQGTCVLKSINGINRYFGCNCYPGYIGNTCGIAVCSSKCSYNGLCTAPETCSCFRGRMGAKCQIDCGCGGHGTCSSTGSCICDAGFFYNTTSKNCEFQCLGQPSANCYAPNLLSCAGCDKGTCNNGSCTCWPGFTGTNCSTETPVTYINNYLGINLASLSYWSTQHLFKDFNKQSSQWIPQYYPNYFNASIQYTWNTSQYFPTQINGYPASLNTNQSVGKLLLRDLQLRYPQINKTNEYVLLYDGDGVINLGMDAKAYQTSAGRIRFTVTPSTQLNNGIYVNLLTTNPANPLRNIRIVLAKDEYNFQKDLLSEDFMTFINQFSTIRFMDLMRTNGNPVQNWNQTTRYDMQTQAMPNGISIQLLTQIVKRTGRNAWVNIPHQATDDYVQNFATYLKNNIPLNRIIYVEYSNEVWNTFFDQGKYATAQATAQNLANYHQFYAKRSLAIFNIFTSVFGVNSPRLKYVVSFQVVSQWVANQILSYPGLQSTAHIIAGAPYYDCNNIGNTTNTAYYAGLTPADIINRCNSSSVFDTLNNTLSIQNTVALNSGLAMAAYEAGTSISETGTIYNGNSNSAATANFIAANQNPGMYDVYKQLLYKYKSNNFTLNAPLSIFSSIGLPSKYGSWGVLDYLDQINQTPTHPKFQAILDFNQGK